jgi:hypothetical protein
MAKVIFEEDGEMHEEAPAPKVFSGRKAIFTIDGKPIEQFLPDSYEVTYDEPFFKAVGDDEDIFPDPDAELKFAYDHGQYPQELLLSPCTAAEISAVMSDILKTSFVGMPYSDTIKKVVMGFLVPPEYQVVVSPALLADLKPYLEEPSPQESKTVFDMEAED